MLKIPKRPGMSIAREGIGHGRRSVSKSGRKAFVRQYRLTEKKVEVEYHAYKNHIGMYRMQTA